MGVTTTKTNKPINPRGNDQSPLAYNRAKLFSGKALDFDGVNDKVTTTYTSGFTGTQEFTYCAYIYIDSVSGYSALVHANENTGYGLQSLQLRDGVFRFFAGTGASATSLVDSELAEINKWYFVVGTHTATENKIYINGVLNGTATAASLTIAPAAIVVGAYPSDVLNFNGKISNVKVFNTALTAAQVADLYNNPEKVVPTGVDNTALKLWLPMQEGAGTTAYDGSGNGNHGTISGATYVHGIGAPVSQTAVIDWNKGTNLLEYSEEFDNAYWSKDDVIISANDTTAPDGQTTAERITDNTNNARHRVLVLTSLTNSSSKATASVFVKEGTHRYAFLETSAGLSIYTIVADLQTGTITDETGNVTKDDSSITSYGNGWYRISVSITAASNNTSYIQFGPAGSATPSYNNYVPIYTGSGEYIYGWGAQVEEADSLGSYIRTEVSKQTSPVLLPQGLTAGRDITGVNLFENVRKQGALNLDGNSWAEVHDNASLDVTTGLTLEAWVYSSASDATAGDGVLSKWHEGSNKRSYLMYALDFDNFYFFVSNDGTASNSVTFGINSADYEKYNHFVCTFDGTNLKAYVNGALYNTSAATFSSIYNSDKNVAIGNYNIGQTPERKYNNSIAQPRIYNRALTAEEVQRNYNAGKNIYTN